jgi:outer membrane protein TolC
MNRTIDEILRIIEEARQQIAEAKGQFTNHETQVEILEEAYQELFGVKTKLEKFKTRSKDFA